MQEILEPFEGKNVLITGHTGFKGSWLSLFLLSLGAKVSGISLDPPTTPSHFDLLGLSKHMQDIRKDIREPLGLLKIFQECQPAIVFHLAAKPLVLESYLNPSVAFEVNVQGTVNVLEAVRKTPSVKAIVVITTDKVYANDERDTSFVEEDRLGAADPYSTSKAMAELAAESYKKSFFEKEGVGLATARAGNVIGGGDFAENRLVPDCMRALFSNAAIPLRNPGAKRPWMHVLDPLYGYLLLGSHLLKDPKKFSTPFNFGPVENVPMTCQEIAEELASIYGRGSWHKTGGENAPQEMKTLQLSSKKAFEHLGFEPRHTIRTALKDTLEWFQGYHRGENILDLSQKSLESYKSLFKAEVCL